MSLFIIIKERGSMNSQGVGLGDEVPPKKLKPLESLVLALVSLALLHRKSTLIGYSDGRPIFKCEGNIVLQ